MRPTSNSHLSVAVFICVPALMATGTVHANAAELYVGAATVSITPDQPVPLSGQMRTRISQRVESEVTATALLIERRDGGQAIERSIMVACDLVAIRDGVADEVRAVVKKRIPELDERKIWLSATHTHTAPEMVEGRYDLPESGIMRPEEYRQFFVDRVASAVEEAWKSRRRARVGWGLGYAALAQNRIAVFADESAKMYGKTADAKFRRFESYEDHGVEVMCFWDADDKLIATAVNVACPAQEVESRNTVNADFWHPIRRELRARHGAGLHVLGWTGAAGDQSPHPMYRKEAEERMRRLRNLDRLDDIARRVVAGWEEAYAGAAAEKHDDVELRHEFRTLQLPARRITQEEALAAKSKADAMASEPGSLRLRQWNLEVFERFEKQRDGDTYQAEVHVLRLGDVAIATNPFELYTEYGVQLKARSPALQTFVVQLAGPGTYLPSARGVQGGAYGAVPQSNRVGPEGGQVLVEQTLEMMHALWPKP